MNVFSVIGLLFLAPSPRNETIYVQADTLRLRAEPSVDAEITGHIGINTPAVVIERRDEWAKLQLLGQSRSEGWASSRFLAEQELSFESAMESARKDGESIKWIERAVAIDGTQRETWESLEGAYLEAGRKKDAAWVRDLIKGISPSIHIAICEDGFIRPRLEVEPDGTIKPLVWGPGTSVAGQRGNESRDEAKSIARQLLGVRWFGLSPTNESFPIPSSAILPKPRVTRQEGNILGHELTVIIGSCYWRDEKKRHNPVVYATQPIRFASSHASLQEFKSAKLLDVLSSTESQSFGDTDHSRLEYSVLSAYRHDTSPQILEIEANFGQPPHHRRALLNGKHEPIRKNFPTRPFGKPTRWFHLKFAPQVWSISIEAFFPEDMGEIGYDIELLRQDGSVSGLRLETSGSGC